MEKEIPDLSVLLGKVQKGVENLNQLGVGANNNTPWWDTDRHYIGNGITGLMCYAVECLFFKAISSGKTLYGPIDVGGVVKDFKAIDEVLKSIGELVLYKDNHHIADSPKRQDRVYVADNAIVIANFCDNSNDETIVSITLCSLNEKHMQFIKEMTKKYFER